MKFFYERTESDEVVVYIEKSYSFYFMIICLITGTIFESELLSLTGYSFNYLYGSIIFVLIFSRLIFMAKMRKEITIAKQSGGLKVTGSRFSLTNPITTEIAKWLKCNNLLNKYEVTCFVFGIFKVAWKTSLWNVSVKVLHNLEKVGRFTPFMIFWVY